MADFGANGARQRVATVGLGSNSALTTITAPASANTKGAWTDISSALPFDVDGFWLNGFDSSANSHRLLIDLGIGSGGAEQTLIENIPHARLGSAMNAIVPLFIPMRLPAGARIAARYQADNIAGSVLTLGITALGASFGPAEFTQSQTANANTANSAYVNSTDPGASANAKGSWAEMVSSCNFDVMAVCAMFMSEIGTAPARVDYRFDIGVGGSGAEQPIISDIPVHTNGTPSPIWHSGGCTFPVVIPAGSRISARAQCSSTATADRAVAPILILFG